MNNNIKNFSYMIEFSIINPLTGNSYNLQNDLSFVYILDDYFNNVSSIYKVCFMCTTNFYEMLRTEALHLKYKITIKSVTNSNQNSELSFVDFYCNALELVPMLRPTAIYKDLKDVDHPTGNINDKNTRVEMSFLPKEITEYNRKIFNHVIYDTNMHEVSRMLVNNIQDMDINIEKPYNSERYQQVILPPNNLYMSFKWLQQQYGMYPYGINIYSKNKALTIKNKLNVGQNPNVYVNLNRDLQENGTENKEGTEWNRDTNYYRYITSIDSLMFINGEIINEEILGTNSIIYSSDLESVYKATDIKENIATNSKMKFYYNGIKNDMMLNEYFLNTKKPHIIDMTYHSANLNMFDLNNTFKFTIYTNNKAEDTYKDKNFQITRNEIVFNIGQGLANLDGKATFREI